MIERYLREMHDIVVEQRDLNNFRWINNIKNKFNTIFGIVAKYIILSSLILVEAINKSIYRLVLVL